METKFYLRGVKALFTHNVDYNKSDSDVIIPHYVNIDLRGRRYHIIILRPKIIIRRLLIFLRIVKKRTATITEGYCFIDCK